MAARTEPPRVGSSNRLLATAGRADSIPSRSARLLAAAGVLGEGRPRKAKSEPDDEDTMHRDLRISVLAVSLPLRSLGQATLLRVRFGPSSRERQNEPDADGWDQALLPDTAVTGALRIAVKVHEADAMFAVLSTDLGAGAITLRRRSTPE